MSNPCTRQMLTGCVRSILQVPPENSLVNYQCYFLVTTMQSQCNAALEAYGRVSKRNEVTNPETLGVYDLSVMRDKVVDILQDSKSNITRQHH